MGFMLNVIYEEVDVWLYSLVGSDTYFKSLYFFKKLVLFGFI